MASKPPQGNWRAPPNWPTPPRGWSPPPGWTPDPRWGPAPWGWQFWGFAASMPAPAAGSSRRQPRGAAAGTPRPLGRLRRPVAWARRHPLAAVPIGVLSLLFLLGVVVAAVSTLPATAPEAQTAGATTRIESPKPVVPTHVPEVGTATAKAAPAPNPRLVRRPAGGTLPDKDLTPGDVFSTATRSQICVPGYSSRVRSVSDRVRRDVFAVYNIDYALHADYEVDHLVPLELGGDNTVANLWPEPRQGSNSAGVKDHLENHLHALVCAGRVALLEAQRAMEGDWFAANTKYAGMTVARSPNPVAPVPIPAPSAAAPIPAPSAPAPAPAPAPEAPAAQTFANCTELRSVYPHGVGRPGAVDHTSGTPVTTFYQSATVYDTNRDHDADGDGIACERK